MSPLITEMGDCLGEWVVS